MLVDAPALLDTVRLKAANAVHSYTRRTSVHTACCGVSRARSRRNEPPLRRIHTLHKTRYESTLWCRDAAANYYSRHLQWKSEKASCEVVVRNWFQHPKSFRFALHPRISSRSPGFCDSPKTEFRIRTTTEAASRFQRAGASRKIPRNSRIERANFGGKIRLPRSTRRDATRSRKWSSLPRVNRILRDRVRPPVPQCESKLVQITHRRLR